ncbi:MAG TPA: glycoside hydrolase domain-containing protein [Fimbriimonas sp.]|nr:glycoside hydrolase domain-containing protein [Fimbriimonas sp.]
MILGSFALVTFLSGVSSVDPGGLSAWSTDLGNHRAWINVAAPADAVRVHLVWRRRDNPSTKRLIIASAEDGKPIDNVQPIALGQVAGDFAFQPTRGAGRYFAYYMPFKTSGSPYFPVVKYSPPKDTADAAWLTRNNLRRQDLRSQQWLQLPQGQVVGFEDRSSFHTFLPMELVAGATETTGLMSKAPKLPFLLFPEDRGHPIKMTDELPERWIEKGPGGVVQAVAKRGEFFTFQVGVWVPRSTLKDLNVRFGELRGQGGKGLPASAFRCFNTGGTDWLGRSFTKTLDVAKGRVQPLWCGFQVPKELPPGNYSGSVTVAGKGAASQTLPIQLLVSSQLAVDAGDDDPNNMSRLRWLDSTIGLDNEVVAPYKPLAAEGSSVSCLGRRVQFGADGLPASIRSGEKEILAAPVRLVTEVGGAPVSWKTTEPKTLHKFPASITRETDGDGGALRFKCFSKMEADGYLTYRIFLTADQAVKLDDVRLEIPFRRDVATYMMGMGRKGGYRPTSWKWDWNSRNANNMVWLGDVDAGLQCKLKDVDDTWDLFKLAHLPEAWCNGGKGGCSVSEQGGQVLLKAYSGGRTLGAGQTLHFNFGLLVTPVKPLDPAHWHWRYDHEFVPPATAKARGATVINIHQGNELNPNINYPFLAAPKLAEYVHGAHTLGLKVKIYYTVRELSNYVAEMWALRSFGDEVFQDGPGGGDSWLQEHLKSHYKPAWHTPLPDGAIDAAIATQGLSRWHNYYLEGLRWLIDKVGIDGLYLDGIGYDREIMKRVRKVMDRTKPGCLIDFHCGNSFQPQYGMNSVSNEFMEHFPYISSLWLGEGFDYNESPDYWLTEISGIPFGLFGEMLEGNGNPWRGMIYGMTARYYSGANPGPIWKLWDEFGIDQAKMIGYWSAACPVRTDRKGVLATAYVRKGKTLVSIASWEKNLTQVNLRITWGALGLDPRKVSIVAPAVEGFQPEKHFKVGEPIPVEPGKGWLLELGESEK